MSSFVSTLEGIPLMLHSQSETIRRSKLPLCNNVKTLQRLLTHLSKSNATDLASLRSMQSAFESLTNLGFVVMPNTIAAVKCAIQTP